LNQATAAVEQKLTEVEKYREERDAARQASARSDGELQATKATLAAAKQPATRPSGFWEKLARIAGEQ
jgi:hypothetical protein